ncbi:MAG: acyl-CoA dehydrogenase family protein [Actinomycetota bacterium]|nr:acyl-CoA dehydrogenase family protein [Actinomycetota bacterium]
MTAKGVSERGKKVLLDFPALAALREHDRKGIDEILGIVEGCAEYKREVALPRALQLDQRMEREPDYFDWETMREACRYNIFSLAIPKVLGGLAEKYMITGMALAVEELSSACGGIGLALAAHSLGVAPVIASGAMAHWDTVLHEIVEEEKKGNPVVMAYGITEPSAGTDVEEPEFLEVGKIGMEAKKVKGGYLLNGRKCFISGGSEAKYFTVTAATDRSRPLQTWTTFLVERDMEGFSTPRVELKMGQRACHAAELLFEDVFVPDSHVLGYEGDGMANGILIIMAASRGPVGAIATGIARGAFEHFLAWTREKRNGKRPIDEDRIRMTLADMLGSIQENRGLFLNHSFGGDAVFRGAFTHPIFLSTFLIPRTIRTSKPYSAFLNSYYGKALVNALFRYFIKDEDVTDMLAKASLAKFTCADNAMALTSRALEVMGADDSPQRPWVEKAYRDAKLTQIYEGTNQLNRLVVYNTEIAQSLQVEIPGPFKKGVR